MGFSQGSDIVAHVGGFVFGAILGTILHFAPKNFRGNGANVLSVFLLVGTVIFTWWLALK